MKVENLIKIELSPDEIGDIIKDYLKSQGYDTRRSAIVFNSNPITRYFTGATIKISRPNIE